MNNGIVAILLSLQDGTYQNASPVLGVSLTAIVIGVIMVCLLILGVLSLGARTERRNRTRS